MSTETFEVKWEKVEELFDELIASSGPKGVTRKRYEEHLIPGNNAHFVKAKLVDQFGNEVIPPVRLQIWLTPSFPSDRQ